MNQREISIATMTWARDAQEERRLRDSLTQLAELRIPTFLTDAGSGKAFLEFLHGFSHFTVFEAEAPGLWPQIKQSIQAAGATPARFILYTEPDKGDFFRHHLPAFIAEAPGADDTGIVLAARSADSFLSFPEFQRFTETAINRCCAELINEPVDFTYGPFIFTKELVPVLNFATADLGWGWRPYVFGIARRLGYHTQALVKDLPCPLEQRADNDQERRYRMRQMCESIQGLLLSTTASSVGELSSEQ
jgi:hypothetical protein